MGAKETSMSIRLNEEQAQAFDAQTEGPPRVLDPRTNKTYVLLPVEQYERVRALLESECDVREAYPLMDAVAAKEGWEDPALDIYNDLDPRRKT
jgi:hypothetical protein